MVAKIFLSVYESINLKRLAFLQTLAGEFVFVLNLELLGDITTHFTAIYMCNPCLFNDKQGYTIWRLLSLSTIFIPYDKFPSSEDNR